MSSLNLWPPPRHWPCFYLKWHNSRETVRPVAPKPLTRQKVNPRYQLTARVAGSQTTVIYSSTGTWTDVPPTPFYFLNVNCLFAVCCHWLLTGAGWGAQGTGNWLLAAGVQSARSGVCRVNMLAFSLEEIKKDMNSKSLLFNWGYRIRYTTLFTRI